MTEIVMKMDDLITAATALPADERAVMVDSLLKSLDPPDAIIDRQWLDIAAQRLEELRTGKVEAIPGAEVLERIRKRLLK